MEQDIFCKKGACYEVGTSSAKMDSLLDRDDLGNKIERDLIKDLMR